MEKWDIYDKDGNKLNKTVNRGEYLSNDEYHLVVNVWIKNNKNELLIAQRSENKTFPLMWECVAGSVLSGETTLDAAIRETKEEIGIDLSDSNYKLIGRTNRYYEGCPDILDVYLFEKNIDINDIIFQNEEVNDVMWADYNTIIDLYKNNKFEANKFFDEIIELIKVKHIELFDVYDDKRNKLGYTKRRGEKLEEKEYNMGVEIWIFNNNKLLMTKRSIEKSHPGEWEVPGGCSQSGESSIDTLIREVKEEIGVSITENDVKLLGTQLYKKQFVDIYESNINIGIDKVCLQNGETDDVMFVSKEEFLKMAKEKKIVLSVYNRYLFVEKKMKLF